MALQIRSSVQLLTKLLFLGLFASTYGSAIQLENGNSKTSTLAPDELFIVVLADGETYAYSHAVPSWQTSLGHLIENGVATHVKTQGSRIFPGIDGSLYFASGGRDAPIKLKDILARQIVTESPITNMPAFPETVFIGDKADVLHQVLLSSDSCMHVASGVSTNRTQILADCGPVPSPISITFSQTRWRVTALDLMTLQRRFDFEYSDILAFNRQSDESAPRVRINGNIVEVDSADTRQKFGPFDEDIYGVYGIVPFATKETKMRRGGEFCAEQFTLSLLARGSDTKIQGSASAPMLPSKEELFFAFYWHQFDRVQELQREYIQNVNVAANAQLRLAYNELPAALLQPDVVLDPTYSWKDFALFVFMVIFVVGGIAVTISFKRQKAACMKVAELARLSNKTDLVPPDSVLGKSLHNGRFLRDFSNYDVIGQGGFGVVFKANFTIEKACYAVKMIPVLIAAGDELNTCANFREVFANLTLSDCGKNVVRYYTSWCEEASYLPVDAARFVDSCLLVTEAPQITAPSVEDQLSNCDSSISSPCSTLRGLPAGSQPCSRRFLGNRVLKKISFDDTVLNMTRKRSIDGYEWDESICEYDVSPWSGTSNVSPWSGTSSTQSHSQKSRAVKSERKAPIAVGSTKSPTSESPSDPMTRKTYKVVICIQMEYCDGRTLADFLKDVNGRSKTPAGTKELNMCRLFIKGLKDIHANNVVHRDLKPANVLVACNTIKIADFGLAVDAGAGNKTEVVGTPGYTPPEGQGTTAGDVYSAALIVFELLHVHFSTAMERVKTLDNFKRNCRVPPEIRAMVPEIANILMKMIDPNPRRRPTSAAVYHVFKQFRHEAEC